MRLFLSILSLLASFSAFSADFNIGQTTVLSNPDSGNGNMLLAQQTTLTQVGTLNSLSFYVSTVGGQLYLGVYSNNAGIPGTLLATTAVFTPIAGWNTKPVVTPVSLAVGTYWLAYHPSSSSLGFVNSAVGGGSKYLTRTFAALPSSFGSPVSTSASQWSFYATLSQPVTGPVNGTPSKPTIVMASFGSMTFAWDAPVLPANPPTTIAGYRLYVGQGASGCPGPTFVSATGLSAQYPHLASGVTYTGQVTTLGADGSESLCSNTATGIPK